MSEQPDPAGGQSAYRVPGGGPVRLEAAGGAVPAIRLDVVV